MEYNFKDKNVLITGADGFIGSHLCKEFIRLEANVIAIVRSKDLKNLNNIKDKIKIIQFDIKDRGIIDYIMNEEIDYIFHLASYIKSDSYENPKEILETNIIGTMNIIESAIKIKSLKRFVYFSTAEVYEDSENAINEDFKVNPKSMYAISKLSSENILKFYNTKLNLPLTIIRLFNTYGPRKIDNVVFFFIKSALNNNDIMVNGKGEQIRDFIYIDDVINACLLTISNENFVNKTINLGSGKKRSIKELAEKIINLCQSNSKIIYRDADPGMMAFYCDNSLLRSYDYYPRIGIDSGLKKTIEWARQNESFI